MDRRQFLTLLTIGGVASPLLGRSGETASGSQGSSSGVLRRTFERLEIPAELIAEKRAIGRSYLEKHPAESEEDKLVDLLLEGNGQGKEASNQRRGHCMLSDQIRLDFESGRTVRVNGWILSRTEARLCALTLLS